MTLKRLLRVLGPGLITGAADDDPSGIATYSQTGAQFGLAQLWTALYTLPFMIAVQDTCARIGAVTGMGLAAVVKTYYSRRLLYSLVLLVVIANSINIGADLGAMVASTQLLLPLPAPFLTLGFALLVVGLQVFVPYARYARLLKWLALSLLAYPLTLLLLHPAPLSLVKDTFIPHIELSTSFFFVLLGVFGTTISPYMFFWQASEEVEERQTRHLKTLSAKFLRDLRLDTIIGMTFSNFTTWCIIAVAALVLHRAGVFSVNTAADAAKALEPLVSSFPNAGFLAKTLFAFGVVGLGLLAVPVLSGSASYAVSEAFNWRASLNAKPREARGFYAVITIATLIGLAINSLGLNPFRMLVITAVCNGIAAVPLLFLIAHIGRRRDILGQHTNGLITHAFVLVTAIAMGLSFIALVVTQLGL